MEHTKYLKKEIILADSGEKSNAKLKLLLKIYIE